MPAALPSPRVEEWACGQLAGPRGGHAQVPRLQGQLWQRAFPRQTLLPEDPPGGGGVGWSREGLLIFSC